MDESLISKFLIFLSKKSPDVFWIRSADYSQQIYISPAYKTIWQRDPEELYQHPEKWADYLYPEDFENMQTSTSKRNACILPEMEFHTEYRIIRPSGEIRYIKDHSFPIFDKDQIHIGFSGIARDVTDDVIMAQNLMKAKAAEAANRAKTEFLANMSHDVKTPMTGVVSVADLMMHTTGWCT
ncbi:MAG: PAS domain-containing protein, partial [Gammaproteobacteria bacterium]|nr:PAS domain-containing protein [Gammaproteobacteria bacterium]